MLLSLLWVKAADVADSKLTSIACYTVLKNVYIMWVLFESISYTCHGPIF